MVSFRKLPDILIKIIPIPPLESQGSTTFSIANCGQAPWISNFYQTYLEVEFFGNCLNLIIISGIFRLGPAQVLIRGHVVVTCWSPFKTRGEGQPAIRSESAAAGTWKHDWFCFSHLVKQMLLLGGGLWVTCEWGRCWTWERWGMRDLLMRSNGWSYSFESEKRNRRLAIREDITARFIVGESRIVPSNFSKDAIIYIIEQ